jgi:anti-sigma B factor antagonist
MDIKIDDLKEYTVKLSGRLDSTTSPKLDETLASFDLKKNLVFDFKELEYISSAGLRLLLAYKKKLSLNSLDVIVRNANDVVMEVFNITGFDKILKLE